MRYLYAFHLRACRTNVRKTLRWKYPNAMPTKRIQVPPKEMPHTLTLLSMMPITMSNEKIYLFNN